MRALLLIAAIVAVLFGVSAVLDRQEREAVNEECHKLAFEWSEGTYEKFDAMRASCAGVAPWDDSRATYMRFWYTPEDEGGGVWPWDDPDISYEDPPHFPGY